jgi:hypothetical protein
MRRSSSLLNHNHDVFTCARLIYAPLKMDAHFILYSVSEGLPRMMLDWMDKAYVLQSLPLATTHAPRTI